MSQGRTVLFFGGNGHAPVRLDPARAVLAAGPSDERFRLVDVVYPGFAGESRASGFEEFLSRIERSVADATAEGRPALVHATGIGAMIVLALRARGCLVDVPTVFLGPVLWGLETRLFPTLMRLPGVARLGTALLTTGWMRDRFARRHLPGASPAFVEAFFDGYRECRHFADLFHWFTPSLLRELEARFAERPEALRGIELWWGAQDAVVGEREADVTEQALSVVWPRRSFPDWGHYPFVVQPEAWLAEVRRALAAAPLGV